MLEVHAILHRQRCYENMTEKTGTLSDAYYKTRLMAEGVSDQKKCCIYMVGVLNL